MSHNLSLRKLTSDDYAFWCNFLPSTSKQSFEDLVKSLIKQEEQDKSYSFVLQDQQQAVGFLQIFNVCRFPAHSAMIEISIQESYRKSGHGRRGMSLLEDFAFNQQKLLRLIAPISPENEASKALFTSLGYEKYFTDPSAFFFDNRPAPHEIWVKVKTP